MYSVNNIHSLHLPMHSSVPSVRTRLLATMFSVSASAFLVTLVITRTDTAPTARLLSLWGTRNMRPIPTCSEAGICPRGERSILLRSADTSAVATARRNGCTVKKQLNEQVVLRCPSSAPIPSSAQEERVFRLNDLYSVTQIDGLTTQSDGMMGQGVRVAVLDTGVEGDHPELSGRVVLQKNFTTDSDDDRLGHGTHVAGIVAGAGIREFDDRGSMNRALGTAPQVEILAGKVCNDQGWCLEGDILAGIEWAVAQKARVINLSLGGGAFSGHCDRDTLAQKANWAVSQGTVVVASSGNGGDIGEGVATPACASKAIAVGAVDAQDVRPVWSSYGDALDVVAPGTGILSSISCLAAGTCPSAAYGWWSGTSMAAPHTTGLVALLLHMEPSLTPDLVYTLMTNSAVDLGSSGTDTYYGQGRIDVRAALALLGYPKEESSSSSSSSQEISEESSSSADSSQAIEEDQPSSKKGNAGKSTTAPGQQKDNREKIRQQDVAPDTPLPSESPAQAAPSTPPLPSQAAPAAQENRPTESRGSPRW